MNVTTKKGRVILGIALAAIMFASVMVAIISVPSFALTTPQNNENLLGQGKGKVTVAADTSTIIIIGETIEFTVEGLDIVGVSEDVLGQTRGTTSADYDTSVEFKAGDDDYLWAVDIVDDGVYVKADDMKISLKEPTLAITIKDTEGKSIDSTTKGQNITLDVSSNLFDDDRVKVKITGPEGTWTEFSGNISVADGRNITTNWKTGNYEIWVVTRGDGDDARGIDMSSNTDAITIRKAEIKIEASTTTPPKEEAVTFTVSGPPNTDFHFSVASHADEVVMTHLEKNPLNLEPGETMTMDKVGGKFNATTDEDGIYKFVTKFTDDRTYTFQVWLGAAATYAEADTADRDDIDIDVQEITVEIKVSGNNAVAEIGEEVVIRGISNIGESVDIVINNTLEFDNVTIEERTFEGRWNTTDKNAGIYEIDVYVDCKELTSEMEGTNVKDITSEYSLEPDDKAWIALINQSSSGSSKGSDDWLGIIPIHLRMMEKAETPTSPNEENYDFLYNSSLECSRRNGAIVNTASDTYEVLRGVLEIAEYCIDKTIDIALGTIRFPSVFEPALALTDVTPYNEKMPGEGKGRVTVTPGANTTLIVGEKIEFTVTGLDIIGVSEDVEGQTRGTTSTNYQTEYEFADSDVDYIWAIDIDGDGYWNAANDMKISLKAATLDISIEDDQGNAIDSTTIGKLLKINIISSLFKDDVVKVKITGPGGTWTEVKDETRYIDADEPGSYVIDTSMWKAGDYEIWVVTDEDDARGVDIASARDIITLRKPEIEIESEMELPPVGEEVMFTVRAPPYTLFNFSTSRPADVVMTAKEDNPLNLSEGEEKRMDEMYGTFSAATDYEGLYKFVVYFTEEWTYRFRVWYDAPTYWETWYRDSIYVEVGDIATMVEVPDTSVAVVGEDVAITVVASAGDDVDIVIDNILEYDDETLVDGEAEVEWDTAGKANKTYIMEVFVNCDVLTSAMLGTDVSDEIEAYYLEADGTATIRLIEPGVTAEQRRNVVAAGDDYIVEGMATGVDEVDIVIIGPHGFTAMPLGVENGLEFLSTSVARSNGFNEDICIPEEADFGEYKEGVFAPGRDGIYGMTGYGEGDLVDALCEEYGFFDVFDLLNFLEGKDQSQILKLITAATIDKPGSDDLAEILNFTVESPYVRFADIEDVPVGEFLKVNGVTNREPETTITINSTIEYLTPHPHLIPTKVKWPTPNYGVFNVTINTTDAVAGNYTLRADDGEGNADTATVEILEAVSIFDTHPGTYPSIMGTHKGEIKPSCNINVSTLYTYACAGTGGHTESIELYENDTLIANGTWNGYKGDWHNITIHNVTDGTPYVTLLKNQEYRYVIKTGSYPQIIHESSKDVTGGTITCTLFEDANGKVHYDWIPAIRLF